MSRRHVPHDFHCRKTAPHSLLYCYLHIRPVCLIRQIPAHKIGDILIPRGIRGRTHGKFDIQDGILTFAGFAQQVRVFFEELIKQFCLPPHIALISFAQNCRQALQVSPAATYSRHESISGAAARGRRSGAFCAAG